MPWPHDEYDDPDPIQAECRCGRGYYNAAKYHSCYTCFLERRESYLSCIWCGRWHSPEYATCYTCRHIEGRDEAGRNLRLDIIIRDDFACQNCGARERIEVDHIEPCAQGGTATPWNLQALCHDCNKTKGSEYDWRWEARRIRLMHLYFTYGWSLLSDEQRQQLRSDADVHAEEYGGDEFVWHARYQPQPSIADTPEMQLLADQEELRS